MQTKTKIVPDAVGLRAHKSLLDSPSRAKPKQEAPSVAEEIPTETPFITKEGVVILALIGSVALTILSSLLLLGDKIVLAMAH